MPATTAAAKARDGDGDEDEEDEEDDKDASSPISPRGLPEDELTSTAAAAANALSESMEERAKYIPMRLTLEERKRLRLLEAALRVSEYTDRIDILSYSSKTKRIHAQIRELCAILCGLTVAADYARGQELIRDRNFVDIEPFFQQLFEIGRRHKILNPEKMRSEYGKMMYMLMDSVLPEVGDLLQFSLVAPLVTVYSTLEDAGALALLRDPLIHVATSDVTAAPNTPRSVIRAAVQVRLFFVCKYKN